MILIYSFVNNINKMITQNEFKFNLKPEQCSDEYGEDTYEDLVTDFIERLHEDKYEELMNGYKNNNFKEIKRVFHTVKTTSKYLFETDFAAMCQKNEEFAIKENYEELMKIKDYSVRYFNALYVEMLPLYIKLKKDKGEEVQNEYLWKIKVPELTINESGEPYDLPSDKKKDVNVNKPPSPRGSFRMLLEGNNKLKDMVDKHNEQNRGSEVSDTESNDSENNDEVKILESTNKTPLQIQKRHSTLGTMKTNTIIEEESEDEKKDISTKSLLNPSNESMIRTSSNIKKQLQLKEELKSKYIYLYIISLRKIKY